MTEMSKINSLRVKKYSLYIICRVNRLNQEQMSLCWSEHLLDMTNENNYK